MNDTFIPSHVFDTAFCIYPYSVTVIGKTEQPRAGTLSPAGLHDNNKDQFDFGSKMQK